eukprot:CAMPEP_0170170014 /NCGR_PEP_ID=MMETSP0040_2-20121228/2965_1 /TAXON_ID=641309 /ORGANISM="Lotharella oceanica, Strain CCMP622" /LENGTH=122 /DNA_ID=CAMNT_0010409119 /DNA_START=820 /DNA_END=1188 /DNA_ORIENTATION=-
MGEATPSDPEALNLVHVHSSVAGRPETLVGAVAVVFVVAVVVVVIIVHRRRGLPLRAVLIGEVHRKAGARRATVAAHAVCTIPSAHSFEALGAHGVLALTRSDSPKLVPPFDPLEDAHSCAE